MQTEAINLDKVTVMHGRMRLEISLAAWSPEATDQALAKDAIKLYPTITMHSCINSSGPSFGDTIAHTSVPHLLEHIIIEEQLAEDPAGLPFAISIVGTTQVAPDHKHATIEVSFFDDLVAIRAIGRALDALNSLLPCKPYLY